MENSKQIIGLLNTTLRGIRLTTGEVTNKTVLLIMKGILTSIHSKKVADEFCKYCLEQYGVTLN